MRAQSSTLFQLVVLGLFLLGGCEAPKKAMRSSGPVLLESQDRFAGSTTAGNLVATALKETQQLDFVFYPSEFLSPDLYAVLDPGNLSQEELQQHVLPLYPSGSRDEFWIGTLKGDEIKQFVLNRTNKNYSIDLQVAGLEYDIQYSGGLPAVYQIARSHRLPLEDDLNYRVAISAAAFANPFPGYRYGNGFENSFQPEPGSYSAREAITDYLLNSGSLQLLDEARAHITQTSKSFIEGITTIPQIQGQAHISPYVGHRVSTQGVITAVAKLGKTDSELYIQTDDDGDPLTSNAINVYLTFQQAELKSGVKIQVTGEVYEIMTAQGLTRTALRNVTDLKVLATDVALPAAILIGPGGIKAPDGVISSYRGNINEKKQLTLTDGIDFWESLEGMRVQIVRPEVVGFRGGKEKYEDEKSGYLTLFVRPEASAPAQQITASNGLFYSPEEGNYNPQVIRISSNPLAPKVSPSMVFKIGDKFNYDLTGILSFQTNNFGDGEFTLFVTGDFAATSSILSPEAKPKTTLLADDDHLTVATWNVENMAGVLVNRIARVGLTIGTNMKCPDIINLPEIQDNNGIEFSGGSSADVTLKGIIKAINCPGSNYKYLNIDPIPNQDGGELGGNIRVAMLYNASRLGFEPRGQAGSLDDTFIMANGELNQNPGRLFPNDPVLNRTRKPLVAQFSFKGQKFFVIGNHLNSKLGDGNLWAAKQPIVTKSEIMRSRLANKQNHFVADILHHDSQARVLVVGDFNAYWFENSMQILAGDLLKNMMTYGDLLPHQQWYTTNFDGNASAIDFIFASQGFLGLEPELEIVHMNSDQMGKISDHDPVISRFRF